MKKFKIVTDGYVRVFEDCPQRHGWIIVLQVSEDAWLDSKYDKYRR